MACITKAMQLYPGMVNLDIVWTICLCLKEYDILQDPKSVLVPSPVREIYLSLQIISGDISQNHFSPRGPCFHHYVAHP